MCLYFFLAVMKASLLFPSLQICERADSLVAFVEK